MWKDIFSVRKIIKIKLNKSNNFKANLADYISLSETQNTKRALFAVPQSLKLNSMTLGYEVVTNVLNKDTINENYEVKILENKLKPKVDTLFTEIKKWSRQSVSKKVHVDIPNGTYSIFIKGVVATNRGSGDSASRLRCYLDSKLVLESVKGYGGMQRYGVEYLDSTRPHSLDIEIANSKEYSVEVYVQNRDLSENMYTDVNLFVFIIKK